MSRHQIAQPVLQVLESAEFVGGHLYLTHLGTLDRKLYQQVDKVLQAMGGKWSRSHQAHVFSEPAKPLISAVIQSGEYSDTKQDLGQFDTPLAVVRRVIELAEIAPGMMALEPSAGIGNIAGAAIEAGARVTCWELDPKREAALRKIAGAVNIGDFLTVQPGDGLRFDRVTMNPPFADQADIAHVIHAGRFLKPGGRLVSVMSAAVKFRQNKTATVFRDWLAAHGGAIHDLPYGAFAESGTHVKACIIVAKAGAA